MCELLLNILGTIIGGLLLTLCLFLLNEYCFLKKNLTGEWDVIVKIEKTAYSPLQNLSTIFKIHLLQKDYELSGSGEKIKDIKPDGSETVFLSEKRVVIEIDGYYERKYFRNSRVYFNIIEEGRRRESRATYFLTIENDTKLKGTFISTAGTASGQIEMTKS